MKRLPMFLSIVAALFVYGVLSPTGGAGFSSACSSSGGCGTAAGGDLITLFIAAAFCAFLWHLPFAEFKMANAKPVGVLRRLGALYANMIVIMFALTPLVVLPILIFEAMYVGEFQWSFARDFIRSSDFLVSSFSVLLIFFSIGYYYYRALLSGRPTIGQYLMGYNVVSHGDAWTKESARRRIGLTLLTLCAWPVTAILAARDPNKAFYFDRKTNSNAERFEYAE